MVDRRVEITGPVDRKMVINALNSGASTYMADFEGTSVPACVRAAQSLRSAARGGVVCADSNTPTWDNNLTGHVNLRDANRRTINYAAGGKQYRLNSKVATLIVRYAQRPDSLAHAHSCLATRRGGGRPRGWHLEEPHLHVDGVPTSGSLFDFGLYFFHNAAQTLQIGIGPYFYLPKMESHLEARYASAARQPLDATVTDTSTTSHTQAVERRIQRGAVRARPAARWGAGARLHSRACATDAARAAAQAPSAPRASSRRCWQRLRWTSFCTSCATTPPYVWQKGAGPRARPLHARAPAYLCCVSVR
jgi:hypothetical protein